ncbi:hypothetical protein PENPOL_c007G05583 [Penicillium polonicum]|uniref:Nucleoside phosphorylase domain-containing protein n=1 Tax=Penicillium polonicum TaxID=60169 RepID=A0A1V6NJN4_PENPO|nr:hypothetical protein PENPOL_c007G05583 [Penicillium polonicum]
MRHHLTKLTRNDYAVGWICALFEEQTAATAMLDQEHPDLLKPPGDSNTYTLGSIGQHNIVIACLPEGRMGTHAATACAMQMMSTFPSIKIGLMVGIGGGIPSKVKLGDVVISMPVDQYPGVVQWDFGKAKGGGEFRRIGALNSPPTVLLTALGKLRIRNRLKRNSLLPQYLAEMGKRWPALVPEYSEPPSSGLVGSQDPRQRGVGDVHCGLIASGNQVIKDAELRDSIDENLGGKVLCVEMEAAGLTNDFPCIVIRGICDYADERKNDEWQPYAAAVAAACARALLEYVPPSHVSTAYAR